MSEPYNVVITAPVERASIIEVAQGGDYYWALWWAVDEEEGTFSVGWWEDGEKWEPDLGRPLRTGDVFTIDDHYKVKYEVRHVSWRKLADGLSLIARGDFQNDPYQTRSAMQIITNYEDADWDAWTGELMLQAALFGKVTFG